MTIETAFLVPGDDGVASVYLVINNRSNKDVMLTSISAPGATRAHLVSARGNELPGVTIPRHTELYMTTGGLQVRLQGIAQLPEVGAALELQLELSDGLIATVPAVVVAGASKLPDHHDYVHE